MYENNASFIFLSVPLTTWSLPMAEAQTSSAKTVMVGAWGFVVFILFWFILKKQKNKISTSLDRYIIDNMLCLS